MSLKTNESQRPNESKTGREFEHFESTSVDESAERLRSNESEVELTRV